MNIPPPRDFSGAQSITGRILAVDDNATNRVKLNVMLTSEGHKVTLAEHGEHALELLQSEQFDLVLLDILMPVLDGYKVLEHMRNDCSMRFIPVIVVSAMEDMASVVRCVLMGAEDYLIKPYNPVLLRARVGATLEKKKLRDAVAEELGRYLPDTIAQAIVAGQGTIEPVRAIATVMYCDIEQFTSISETMPPEQLVEMMNEYFPTITEPITRHGGVVAQFLGDAIMATFNVPLSSYGHADHALHAAAEIRSILADRRFGGHILRTRIGISTGVVVAGNVGTGKRLSYTVYGDTVNLAARLEALNKQHGTLTLVSESTVELLNEAHSLRPIGEVTVRGKTNMVAIYELMG